MSKRPTAGTQKFSRVRLPMGWLRNAPIWSKLGLIMIVPTIATVVVGMLGLVDNYHRASDADQSRLLAGLTADSGALVHELQNERAASTLLLGGPSNDARAAFDRQAAATDEANKRYRLRRTALAGLPADFRGQLNRIDTQLSDLTKQRDQIKTSSQQNATEPTTLSNAIFRYQTLIGDLVSIRGSAAQLANDQHLSGDMRASAALSQSKEYLAEERVVVLQALLQRSMPVQMKVQFIGTLKGQEQALRQFQAVAVPPQRALYDKTVSGADRREAENFQSTISSLGGDELPGDIFTPGQWDRAMVGQADLVRKVETALDTHAVSDAASLRDQLQRRMVLQVGMLLGLLMLSILFAWIVARSMARSLRELRHGALTVAQYGLPQAVARLRDPQLASQATPQQLAAQIAEPLPVRSHDEFGQVAEAFNAVHLEAVRTAAEQAALRASVATMFVNLARRSQILVDRLIGHLDRLERGEEDPDRLSELFQLDHLATRMRRNDENLLVLAGADSTRIQREPAPLMDVLRAAQSEVEHYTRIEFGMIDRDVEIAPHSVNDMVHLIAELLDNATAFSPPDSPVVVEARRVGDRAVLIVEDRGIGISPDQLRELNERLANPPMVDVAVSRMMGLVVVARLAARHGVKVELRPARERGTVADLTLPASVLVPRALAGRGGMPVAGSRELAGADRPTGAPERSPLGPPLALESASSAVAPPIAPREPAGTGAFPSMDVSPWIGVDQGVGASSGVPGPALNGSASGPFTGPSDQTNSRPFGDSGTGATGLFGGSHPTSGAPWGSGDAGSSTATPSRGQPPAWSDLIGNGGSGSGDNGAARPPAPPQDGAPLPQRRPTEPSQPDSAAAAGDGMAIPRQWPLHNGAQGEDGAASLPEAPVVPQAPGQPHAHHPADEAGNRAAGVTPAAPPAWPPVPKQAESEVVASAEPPYVPPVFSAALDMTAEMPRVRVDWEQDADHTAPAAAGPNGGTGQRFADETMELPIFRELESAWFHKPSSGPIEAVSTNGTPATDTESHERASVPSATPERNGIPAAASSPLAAVEASDESAVPAMSSAQFDAETRQSQVPAESPSWQTAADEGWQAASALAEEQDFMTTPTGLPKRVPMSQLVPGGVEKGTVSAHKRTPEAVRGLLSAYHRGVQRGRSNKSGDAKTPEHTTAGPQSSQGGKEQEA
ncbi:MAG: putative sensor-like histidine kinase [Dactylosporangium sp.]|nr:putative sensor-like histidine kinase [Dactylosporangium sp.]